MSENFFYKLLVTERWLNILSFCKCEERFLSPWINPTYKFDEKESEPLDNSNVEFLFLLTYFRNTVPLTYTRFGGAFANIWSATKKWLSNLEEIMFYLDLYDFSYEIFATMPIILNIESWLLLVSNDKL